MFKFQVLKSPVPVSTNSFGGLGWLSGPIGPTHDTEPRTFEDLGLPFPDARKAVDTLALGVGARTEFSAITILRMKTLQTAASTLRSNSDRRSIRSGFDDESADGRPRPGEEYPDSPLGMKR